MVGSMPPMKVSGLKTQMDERFAQLKAEMDSRFEHVDERFEQVDGRFAEVDARFDRVEQRIIEEGEATRRHFDMVAEQFKDYVSSRSTGQWPCRSDSTDTSLKANARMRRFCASSTTMRSG